MKIVVIAGFLGSGKTTLLLSVARRLSAGGRNRLAIVENEAGKVGVDGALVQAAGLEVREIFGGCVCCSMGANLLVTLHKLETALDPDYVILEPSGVAGPQTIRQVIDGYDGNIESVRLAVLFDVERYRAISHVARPLVMGSIAAADVLAVSKVDLVDREQVVDLADQLHQQRSDVSIVALSSKTGEGENRLVELLTGGDNGRRASPGGGRSGTEHTRGAHQGDDHAHDHAHAVHEHPGSPIVEARALELAFDQPAAGESVATASRGMVESVARAIAAHGGAVIGHVKAVVGAIGPDGGRSTLVLRTTSADRPADADGPTVDRAQSATVTFNALAYAMEREALCAAVDRAAQQVRHELGVQRNQHEPRS